MSDKIVVVGGGGYIGSVMCGMLLERDYQVVCADRFFFGEQTVEAYSSNSRFQKRRIDTRNLPSDLFDGARFVIDLAGLSNDPLCDLSETLTETINTDGAIAIAELAKKSGVEKLIYSSSCSIYGQAGDTPVAETAPPNPVSLYAKCKFKVEQSLTAMKDKNFAVVFPRLSTVYGLSPRMRFDLVVNLMMKDAYANRRIVVTGGGRQWRPVVHVRDVGRFFCELLAAPVEKINGEVFNVGCSEQNYRAVDIARNLQDIIPGVSVDVVASDPDKRSYRVDFTKAVETFGFKPEFDIFSGAEEVLAGLRSGTVDPVDPRTVTLHYYKYLMEAETALNKIRLDGRIL